MTWTPQTWTPGQVLTAAQMTLLSANFAAMANGDSGAPSIVQGALSTAQAENTTTGTITELDLTGGEYAFLLELKNSTTSLSYTYGGTNITNFNVRSNATSYSTRMMFGAAANTAYIRHRYIQASPPYDLGDGEIPLFIFVVIDSTTKKILATSTAPDAPWHNNGPTKIGSGKYLGGVGYRPQKDLSNISFTYLEAVKDKAKLREYIVAMKEADIVYEPITQELKNRDMALIPTPGFQLFDDAGNDITGNTTTVMLDPVCDLTHQLAEMHNNHKDFSLGDLLHDDRFKIDNEDSGRKSPPGILVPKYRWK